MLRRTPMRRKAPTMPAKRDRTSEFASFLVESSAARMATRLDAGVPKVVEKDAPVQHQGYMALVRLQPCQRCGWYRKGWMQFCHADEGKGMGIKSDCRLGWSGCGPHDGLPGCHWIVGTSGQLSKEERREFERWAGRRTRSTIVMNGQWPKRLPKWEE